MTIVWNKVTWYSKIAAVILFVATFFLGFWLGTMNAAKIYVKVPYKSTEHNRQPQLPIVNDASSSVTAKNLF